MLKYTFDLASSLRTNVILLFAHHRVIPKLGPTRWQTDVFLFRNPERTLVFLVSGIPQDVETRRTNQSAFFDAAAGTAGPSTGLFTSSLDFLAVGEVGLPSRMLDFASRSAAHSAAPTVFVNVKTNPTIGTKLNTSAPMPNLHETTFSVTRRLFSNKIMLTPYILAGVSRRTSCAGYCRNP